MSSDADVVVAYSEGFVPVSIAGDFLIDGTLSVEFNDLPSTTRTVIFGFAKRMVMILYLCNAFGNISLSSCCYPGHFLHH